LIKTDLAEQSCVTLPEFDGTSIGPIKIHYHPSTDSIYFCKLLGSPSVSCWFLDPQNGAEIGSTNITIEYLDAELSIDYSVNIEMFLYGVVPSFFSFFPITYENEAKMGLYLVNLKDSTSQLISIFSQFDNSENWFSNWRLDEINNKLIGVNINQTTINFGVIDLKTNSIEVAQFYFNSTGENYLPTLIPDAAIDSHRFRYFTGVFDQVSEGHSFLFTFDYNHMMLSHSVQLSDIYGFPLSLEFITK